MAWTLPAGLFSGAIYSVLEYSSFSTKKIVSISPYFFSILSSFLFFPSPFPSYSFTSKIRYMRINYFSMNHNNTRKWKALSSLYLLGKITVKIPTNDARFQISITKSYSDNFKGTCFHDQNLKIIHEYCCGEKSRKYIYSKRDI